MNFIILYIACISENKYGQTIIKAQLDSINVKNIRKNK